MSASMPSTREIQHDEERSLGDVLSDLATHSQALVRGEMLMFKREMSQNLKAQATGAALGAGAAILAVVALIMFGHLVAQALDEVMATWVAYLLTTLLYAAGAGALGALALKAFRSHPLLPETTIDHAKEDLSWIQTHR